MRGPEIGPGGIRCRISQIDDSVKHARLDERDSMAKDGSGPAAPTSTTVSALALRNRDLRSYSGRGSDLSTRRIVDGLIQTDPNGSPKKSL